MRCVWRECERGSQSRALRAARFGVRCRRALSIAAAWLGGIALYAYDYRAGFAVFYVLSIAHVMLEFPLNHQTLVGIVRLLRPEPSRAPEPRRMRATAAR